MMRSKISLFILIFSGFIFIASILLLLPHMPERMATHFDGGGHPNGWMGRKQNAIFILLLGFGVPGIMSGILYSVRFAPPARLNVPNAIYWRQPQPFSELCDWLLQWSFWFGSFHLIWTTILNYLLLEANRIQPPNLANAPIFSLCGLYVVGIAVLILILVLFFSRQTKPTVYDR